MGSFLHCKKFGASQTKNFLLGGKPLTQEELWYYVG
jgi:hypothetical protein